MRTASQQKWNIELSLDANFSWPLIYQTLYETTDDIPLRWLQFRILHRILPANKHLQMYGIKDTDKCRTCPLQVETLTHIFWLCPKSHKLWCDLSRVYNIPNFEKPQVMLNYYQRSVGNMPKPSIRLLTLISKQYIWYCRARSVDPTLEGLRDSILAKVRVEKYVSKIKEKIAEFDRVWNPITNPLTQ